MLCERCRIREANIQYTEVINGVKKDHHFCAQCAKEMDFGPYSAIFDGDFPLGKLLSGLLGIESTSQVPDKRRQIVCPTCKTSYEDFVKNSRFGCGDCYSVFGPLMEESLKQLQGSVHHTGKKPKYHEIVYMPGGGSREEQTGGAIGTGRGSAGADIADADRLRPDDAGAAGSDPDNADGKSSGMAEGEEEILVWDARLKEALRSEDYEEAAVCRDQIKELKKGHGANA